MSKVADYNKKNMQKAITFALATRNENPSVEGRFYPPSHRVLAEEIVWDEETNAPRLMKWVAGEQSIWADQHSEIGKNKAAQFIEFANGFKIVSPRETTLLEFLRKSERNKTNPNSEGSGKTAIYFEVEPAKTAEERMSEDLRKHKAKSAAYDMGVEELVAYARVLGLNIDREVAEIRYDMVRIADHNHEMFLSGLDNPKTKRKHKILEALDRGVIRLNNKSGEFSWADSGMTIYKARPDEQPVDGFVEFTFNKVAQGPEVYSRIKSIMDPSSVISTADLVDEVSDVSISAEDMLDLALNSGIIKEAGGSWYKWSKDYFNGDSIEQGKTKMLKRLEQDEDLVDTINTLLA
jgi:hypothetical protein